MQAPPDRNPGAPTSEPQRNVAQRSPTDRCEVTDDATASSFGAVVTSGSTESPGRTDTGRRRLLRPRWTSTVAPGCAGTVTSAPLRVRTRPRTRPAGRTVSWARSVQLTVYQRPGFSGVGRVSESRCAASIQPRVST